MVLNSSGSRRQDADKLTAVVMDCCAWVQRADQLLSLMQQPFLLLLRHRSAKELRRQVPLAFF